ncbi:MAG TPA: BON domain-containing protein [Nannocystis sp.]
MTRRKLPFDDGFRHPGDVGQGPRFPWGFAESRVPLADASYQGYGAYATLDGSRLDDSEYADLDYTGIELEPALSPPDHRGRGPRGYRRSDASIHDDLCALLTVHPDIDASDIEVDVRNGVVQLRGTVDSRATKRFVEDLAHGVRGVLDIDNFLRVGPPPGPSEPELTASVERPDPGPRSTRKDDHPSRRDAWMNEHRRDFEAPREQPIVAADRADLRSFQYPGPRDTSAQERLEPPDELPIRTLKKPPRSS